MKGDENADAENTMEDAKSRLLQAALPHVPFDGWSEATLTAAATESAIRPRWPAPSFPAAASTWRWPTTARGDDQMRDAIAATDLGALRFRDRIATAVKLRLAHADRELVRRGTALFALPRHASEGARAIWGTADAIWTALGRHLHRSQLVYQTGHPFCRLWRYRALLDGRRQPDHAATWEFLDRRIENVMGFENAKAKFRENPLGKALLNGPLKVLERVRAPQPKPDLPGKT